MSILINIGENRTNASPADDDNILSEFNTSVEVIEPEEIDETVDEELPDIDFKD